VTGPHRKSPRFLPLALGATLGIGALVVGLVALRRSQPTTLGGIESAVPSAVATPTPLAPPERAPHQDAAVGALRAALPANAWVVLDVDLSLLGAAGWADPNTLRPLNCEEVPPPSRLALALMPSGAKNAPATDTPGWPGAQGVPPDAAKRPNGAAEAKDDAPDLVVAALGASEAFRACAKRKLLADGGSETAWPGGYEVVTGKSNTRLVIDTTRDRMLFATATAPATNELVQVLQGARPSANDEPAHRALSGSIGMRALGVTVTLPAGWLARVGGGPEAGQSPLAALRAAAIGLRLDGSLEAGLTCNPPSPAREPDRRTPGESAAPEAPTCDSLARFISRAKDDVLRSLPPERRAALGDPFQLEVRSPTELRVTWRVKPSDLESLLAPFVRGRQ
jgi:hypothetical protein